MRGLRSLPMRPPKRSARPLQPLTSLSAVGAQVRKKGRGDNPFFTDLCQGWRRRGDACLSSTSTMPFSGARRPTSCLHSWS